MKNSFYRRICIICEGYEEQDYLKRLIDLNVFNRNYEFILINAKSIFNIFLRYQEKYASNSYHLVLMFCDTDKLTEYKTLKQQINKYHTKDVANEIIMYGNPCTMQIILSHFIKIKLKSQSKNINAHYIEQVSGIINYKAKDNQRNELMNKINRTNYKTLKENISELEDNDTKCGTTNFLKFISYFESEDSSWIDEINV